MRAALAICLAGLALSPASALAARTPSGGAATPESGGAHYGETPKTHGLAALPHLKAFSVSKPTLSATVSFRIASKLAVRDVRLQLLGAGGGVVKTLRLGTRKQGKVHKVIVSKTGLKAGSYRIRITAKQLRTAGIASTTRVSVPKPPKPKPAPPAPPAAPLGTHVFPVRGTYTFGGADARFGAGRSGHTHQGQDIAAAEGTPVVAPHAGTVKAVRYQAAGAGHYIVLDGAGEERDYVFMHLATGTTLVTEGQTVAAGQQLAQVGNTGRSFGAHLHFEIWDGRGWYTGGKPIDPLPLLKAWAAG